MQNEEYRLQNIPHSNELRTDHPQASDFPICMYTQSATRLYIILHVSGFNYAEMSGTWFGWLPLPTPSTEALQWEDSDEGFRLKLPSGAVFIIRQPGRHFVAALEMKHDTYHLGRHATFERAHAAIETWLKGNRYVFISNQHFYRD